MVMPIVAPFSPEGIAPSSAYELMHEKEFPTLRIGNRIVVPKEKFIEWVQKRTEGERG